MSVLFGACLCIASAIINYSQTLSVTSPRSWSLPLRAQRKLWATCCVALWHVAASLQHSELHGEEQLVETELDCIQDTYSTTNHPLLAAVLPSGRGVFRLTRWGWSGARRCSTLWFTAESCFKCFSLLGSGTGADAVKCSGCRVLSKAWLLKTGLSAHISPLFFESSLSSLGSVMKLKSSKSFFLWGTFCCSWTQITRHGKVGDDSSYQPCKAAGF